MSLVLRLLNIAALIVLAAGCPSTADEAAGIDGPFGAAPECSVDSDCVPAGSSCCDCPTFALPATSGYAAACEDLGCEAPSGCADQVAACQGGGCVLQCRVIRVSECPSACPNGYLADAAGCLGCQCRDIDPGAAECASDTDCVQVPADCCGCARGGVDTAVPAGEASAFTEGLDCDPGAQCPDVDVCDLDQIPRCVGGSCRLAAAGGAGLGPDAGAANPSPTPQYCGTDQYPDCPAGTVCVLNSDASAEANMAGIGVCQPE